MSDVAIDAEETLIKRAEALVPQLRERGTESEELRRLPDATLADFEAADIYRAMRPAEAGGLAVGLRGFTEVTRVLSRGDASAGWLGAFFMAHGWLMSKLGAQAQEEIFAGRPWALAAATVTQAGSAIPTEGGFRVTGRWRFASGILHSRWVVLMALSETGPVTCVVPVDDVKIHDTWDVPGMKATGSNDVEADDVFVPEHRTAPIMVLGAPDNPGAQAYDYPLLRYPVQRVLPLIHAAVGLGTADAALELFPAVVERRTRPLETTRAIDAATTHEVYAKAWHERRCAELLLRDAIELLDECYAVPGEGLPPLQQRAEVNLAIAGSAERAFAAIDLMIRNAGASVHRTGNPLDRICRDTQVMRNHAAIDWSYNTVKCGQVFLGLGLGDSLAEAQF